MQYKSAQGTTSVINEAFIDLKSISPSRFYVSSKNGSFLSALWIGSNDGIEIRVIYRVDLDDLTIKFSTVIKNVGKNTLTNLYCKFL